MYPIPDGLFAARHQWYVAAWSKEVGREPMERMILGEPVALYRKEDGQAVALHGRCPHRSFPLGRSRLVGDSIECGYHGIRFGPDGSCQHIPTQAQIPKSCSVRAYPVVERWKWLWIWPGDPALADPSLIPDHFAIGLTDPQFKTAGDVFHEVAGRYLLLHDNLFDLTHIGHLHRHTLGPGAGLNGPPTLAAGERWVESHWVQAHVPAPPFLAPMLRHDGLVTRLGSMRLYLPCLHVGREQWFVPGEDGQVGERIAALHVFHAVTPATTHTTNYFWGVAHTWDHEDPEHTQKLAASIEPALREDAFAVEAVEKMIARSGGRPDEVLLKSDLVCVRGRRMLEAMIRAELPHSAAG